MIERKGLGSYGLQSTKMVDDVDLRLQTVALIL